MNSGFLATILLLACANAPAATGATGVRGSVHISPAHPGPQRIGESGRAPMAGAAVQVRDNDQRVVARVVTDTDGRFSLTLPAGEYVFNVDTGEAMLPRCEEARASVRDGQIAEVQLDCDSGMR
jgi:hypothetical protein